MYINPSLEYEHLSEWLSTLITKPSTPRIFVRRLSRYLNSQNHPVRIKLHHGESKKLSLGEFAIGAEYDPNSDEQKNKQFLIDFILNAPTNIVWHVTSDNVENMALELTEVLIHEYEHQRQYRQRRYRVNKEKYISAVQDPKHKQDQEYLGAPDEINAYAANIAARYYIQQFKLNKSVTIDCPDLQQYYKVFGKNHKIVKLLVSKINENIKYYKENDNGKTHKRACKRSRDRRL